mgnify:CR=1 FL=1
MAPFPETEIMTLKRLEVALKKGDYKLLKEGTYKLHEKYHSGFQFEYIDMLKDILYNTNNTNVPEDIKDILVPTLEDILSTAEVETQQATTSPYESLNQNKVSSLTSLGYTHQQQNEEQQTEEKISAFDVFAAPKSSTTIPTKHELNNNIQQEEKHPNGTFEKFTLPEVNPVTVDEVSEEQQEKVTLQNNIQTQKIEQNNIQNLQQQQTQTVANRTKTLSIFYSQINSEDKNKNTIKYKEIISKLDSEKVDFFEVIQLLSSINTQSNASIVELTNVFEQIQNKHLKINLITNSTNSHLIGLLESIKIPYKINSTEEKINLLPLFGLANIFKCTQCDEKFIDTKDDITPFVLQCPKCKSPMLPDFSCIETKINLDFYNSAIINLASSDVWLILYPSVAENSMLEIMKSALKLNKNVQTVFIVDKDINAKEIYKSEFLAIKDDLKVNTDINTMEDFLKSI